MSKLKEYLKLAKDGLPNFDKIVEGIINDVKLEHNLLSQEEQEEIMRRRLICQQCPLFSLNTFKDDTEYKKLFNKSFESDRINEEFCTSCGCPIKTKTASLDTECGLKTYNDNNPDNIQTLKWNKYNETTN